MKHKVVIVATGGANIASLQFALERAGAESTVTADAAAIAAADRVILPGVGAARDAMQRLAEAGLDEIIADLRCPVLGICLGMQLLFEHSAEDDAACCAVLPGRAERLAASSDLPVPHMGWNTLEPCDASPLLRDIEPGSYAYFVHSYALPVGEFTTATTTYGRPFSACVQLENFFGTQFHPERSGAVGARIIRNFLKVL